MSFIAQLALVVSGVFAARMLGVGDRGRLALLVLFATIVTQLGSLGMPLALTYWIAREPATTPRLVRRVALYARRQLFLLVIIQALILFLAVGGTPGYEQTAAAISLAGTPALIAWQYALATLQGQRRFTAWNLCRLIFPIGYAIVIVGLYVGHSRDLAIVVGTWVALLWLSALAATGASVRGVGPLPAREGGPPLPEQTTMLRFGLKALLGSVSPLQTFNLDQAVVGLLISPVALGIYVVAVSFTNIPFFIAQSVGAVAYPNIAAHSDRRYVVRAIAASALAVLVLAGVVVGLLELALPWLVSRLFGTAFAPSVGVARILLIYAILVALRRVLGDCARGAGYPGLSTLDEMSSLLCLVPLVALLVGHGVKGVALAMVISASVGLTVVVVGLIMSTGRPDSRWRHWMNRSGPILPPPASPPVEP